MLIYVNYKTKEKKKKRKEKSQIFAESNCLEQKSVSSSRKNLLAQIKKSDMQALYVTDKENFLKT